MKTLLTLRGKPFVSYIATIIEQRRATYGDEKAHANMLDLEEAFRRICRK